MGTMNHDRLGIETGFDLMVADAIREATRGSAQKLDPPIAMRVGYLLRMRLRQKGWRVRAGEGRFSPFVR